MHTRLLMTQSGHSKGGGPSTGPSKRYTIRAVIRGGGEFVAIDMHNALENAILARTRRGVRLESKFP